MLAAMVRLDEPLRPADFPTVPYEDATPLLADLAALRRHAGETGYLFLPGLLPDEVVGPVRAFVRDYCLRQGWLLPDEGNPPQVRVRAGARLTGRGWDDARFVELQRELRLCAPFQALGQCRAVLDILSALAGQEVWMATANYCWVKLPGSPAQTTRPHQDRFYLPACPSLWTGWVPLADIPLEVGPLGVVPRSHHRDWPHIDAQTGIDVPADTTWATGPVRAGDVLLFDTGTVHCGWSNMSETLVRLCLDIRYEARPGAGEVTPLRPLG